MTALAPESIAMIHRRHWLLTVLLLVAGLVLDVRPASAQARISAVESIAITVGDLESALDFYTRVLPFERVSDVEVAGTDYEHLVGQFGVRLRVARLRLGDEQIDLIDYLTPGGRPIPVDSRSQDRWFQHIAIIVSDMDRAYRHLRAHRVGHASTGPQTLPDWNKNAGGIKAFYFRDPEGHVLEILQFPPDKGDPKWQRPSESPSEPLFLGIDHTAIVVSDTEQSLSLYRDRLGLKVAGGAENWGVEQEHLNNVFGARLRITALRADSGPGIEFLEYLAPRDGRPYPTDSRAGDLWHWWIRLAADDLAPAEQALRAGHDRLISPGIVTMSDAALGLATGLSLRDPDGHALMLAQPPAR